MAFGSLDDHPAGREPMADINTTPLVDVMLVLLVIFIITAPLFTQAVKLDLPKTRAAALREPVKPVVIALDADGMLYWNDEPVSEAVFAARLADVAHASPSEPPPLHLRADQATRYERIAMVMSAAQEAGLVRIAFLTEPPAQTVTAGAAGGHP